MTLKMKIIIVVIAVIAAVIIAACIYNSIFPKKYLKDKYPNAEIVCTETENGGFNGLFTPSDYGYRYFNCSLYDPSEDIHFRQNFELVWYFPFYRPITPADNFEIQLAYKTLLYNTMDDMKAITEKYANECTVVPNPFDRRLSSNGCGCHIFVNRLGAKDLADLTAELDSYIRQKRRQDVLCYISYSVSICMDDEIYNKFAETDFSKAYSSYTGHAYFTDMLTAVPEFEATRITASNNGFSSSIYENNGDPANDEYQDPNGFDHLVFWYDSEPNDIGHQMFYLFGVNEKE